MTGEVVRWQHNTTQHNTMIHNTGQTTHHQLSLLVIQFYVDFGWDNDTPTVAKDWDHLDNN